MFKERKQIMKTLRYLLIVVSMMSVLGLNAQNTTLFPEAKMHSTSAMIGSGSTLPSAAREGIVTTYSANDKKTYYSGPRRERPGDNKDPYEDPIGDAMLPMMMMIGAYCGFVALRRRKAAR